MVSINELPEDTTLSSSDKIAIYDSLNGSPRKASLNTLQSFILGGASGSSIMETLYAAPSATAWSASANPVTQGNNVFLIVLPSGLYASGTVVLPTTPKDQQVVSVYIGNGVSSLAFSTSGKLLAGPPLAITGSGAFFKLIYNQVYNTWFRFSDRGDDPYLSRTQWSTTISSTNIAGGASLNLLTLIPNASKTTTGSDAGPDDLNIASNGIIVPWRNRIAQLSIRLVYTIATGSAINYTVQLRRIVDNSIICSFQRSRNLDFAGDSCVIESYVASATDPFVLNGFYIAIANPTATTIALSTSLNLFITTHLR